MPTERRPNQSGKLGDRLLLMLLRGEGLLLPGKRELTAERRRLSVVQGITKWLRLTSEWRGSDLLSRKLTGERGKLYRHRKRLDLTAVGLRLVTAKGLCWVLTAVGLRVLTAVRLSLRLRRHNLRRLHDNIVSWSWSWCCGARRGSTRSSGC
jgi:hypothetical protein